LGIENWSDQQAMKILGLALLLFAADLLAAQQPQPASIEGVVVTLGSGEPLDDATVQLDREMKVNPDDIYGPPPGRGANRFAHTDQNGRFVFENVTPGDYRLIATRSGGYVPGEYGQRTATGTGMVFSVAGGQRMADVRLSLSPTGSISGRVYDRNGEAVGKAQVQALQSVYKNGHKKLTIIQIVQSNDRGEYRLFWLPPGTYYVSAKPDITELPRFMGATNSPPVTAVRITEPSRFSSYEQAAEPVIKTRVLKTGEVVEELNVPVYYPGVVDAQSATAIPVTAGGTVGGVDISVAPGTVPARHILGRVISAVDGQLVADAYVTVYPRTSDPLYSLPGKRGNSNGLFDIPGVQPGSYTVSASSRSMNGRGVVDVGARNVENLTVVVRPAFSLAGRFIIDGRSHTRNDPKMEDLRIGPFTPINDVPGLIAGGPSFAPPPEADGSFHLDGIAPGDFRISTIHGVPEDAYVQSIRLGDDDVLEGGLHLTGPTNALLQVVVGANAGSIEGSVVDSRNQPLANWTVVFVPDGRLSRRTDLYKNVSTDGSGRFRMHGLTPGDYKLFAWQDLQTGAWEDPEFMRTYEGRATPVHVNEGTNNDVQLTVIP
jgi:hypothetical protein